MLAILSEQGDEGEIMTPVNQSLEERIHWEFLASVAGVTERR